MNQVEVPRKSRLLRKARFGCLRGAYTINVTRGCSFMCAYCYARGYPDAPHCGEVRLYVDLCDRLAAELDNPKRRSRVTWVVFNTASDCFQHHPRIQDMTFRTMEVLLDRDIGFSFLTKGWIPDRFVELFSSRSDLINARIGLVSIRPEYRDIFEPHTATASERLDNIDRLTQAGVEVEVRVDPMIPFFTDDERSIKDVAAALSRRRVRVISLSYLHLRPAVLAQLSKELPSTSFKMLESCFKSQPWAEIGCSSRSKMLPRWLRQDGYRRFTEIAKGFGLTALVCACKNPDMEAQQCSPGLSPDKVSGHPSSEVQLSLFLC